MDQIELDDKREAPPPLAVMALNLRTVVNNRTQQVEIVAISCLIQNEFHVDRAAPQPPFQQHFCRKLQVRKLLNDMLKKKINFHSSKPSV